MTRTTRTTRTNRTTRTTRSTRTNRTTRLKAAAAPEAAQSEVDFGPLTGYLGYQIRQAQSAIFRDIAVTLRDVGITPGEFSLLALIDRNRDLSSAALARTYGLDKATLSLALGRLAKRRLISTQRSTEDRRYVVLGLTGVGRQALRRARACIERQERAMDAALAPGERAKLLDMLRRIGGAFGR